jgi:hypothetical protein
LAHLTFVEVRLVAEAERRVPRLELLRAWKKQPRCRPWHKQAFRTTVSATSPGALALMMAWTRSAMLRSDGDISAIFASTALSSLTGPARARRPAVAFSSAARSRIAARSSAVNPFDPVLAADFGGRFLLVLWPSPYGGAL